MKKNQKNFSLIRLLIIFVVVGIIAVSKSFSQITALDQAAIVGSNEASAIESLRAIVHAQSIYQATNPTRNFALNLETLVRAGLIDEFDYRNGSEYVKNGYIFAMTSTNATNVIPTYFDTSAVPQIFGMKANIPRVTGTRSFAVNERGIINYTLAAFSPSGTTATVRAYTSGTRLYNMFPNKFDFNGDGRSEISVFSPSNGTWYVKKDVPTIYNYIANYQLGSAGDQIIPFDYVSEGRTRFAVFRDGMWKLENTLFHFGEPGDIPVPADYNGDTITDIAVFRPSNGVWYIQFSQLSYPRTENFIGIAFGQAGDKPIAGDFDGDGIADLAVFRPSEGIWYIQQSSLGFRTERFGVADDKLVAADYDGDGKMDIAVYRPSEGVWYLNQSKDGIKGFKFGISTDVPVPADYNGDGKTDIAVFRDGMWYIWESGVENFRAVQFGSTGDIPVPSAFVR